MGLDAFFGGGGPVKKSTKKTTQKATEKTTKKSVKKSRAVKKTSAKNEGLTEQGAESSEGIDDEEEIISKSKNKTPSVQTSMSSKKKNLECKNKKCGYKKTLFKTTLKPEDLVCAKCGGEMVQK